MGIKRVLAGVVLPTIIAIFLIGVVYPVVRGNLNKTEVVYNGLNEMGLILTLLTAVVFEIESRRYISNKEIRKIHDDFETKFKTLDQIVTWTDKNPVPISFSCNNKLNKNNLNHISTILDFAVGEKYKSFWANIYLMRSLSPAAMLNKGEDDFLFLIRGVEEARAIPGLTGDTAIRQYFQEIQENDYKNLFNMVNRSYYTTSFDDHDVWVIQNNNDLLFFRDNYIRDQELKFNNQVSHHDTNGKNLMPGIHRIFIVNINNFDSKFINSFINGFNGIIQNANGLFDIGKLNGFAITNNNFKTDPRVQLLSVLLAAKIHDKLNINFGIIPLDDDKDSKILETLETLNVIQKKSECLIEWECLNCKRLGSSLFDDTIYAYAEKIQPANGNGNHPLIYYKFNKNDPEKFAQEIVSLSNIYKGFSKITQYQSILDQLDPISEKLAEKIRNL